MFVFLRSWQHMAFASQKVFWSVPQTVISIGLTVSCGFFWANFRKGSVQGSADHSSHLSPTGMLLHSNSLEGSANFTLISKSRELLTCLTHGNPVRRDHPSCRCCWGILWAYFTKSGGRISKEKSETIPQKMFGDIFH